jgi:plasmid stability protein
MATLNIKNLPDSLYRRLQARARREHRSVAQQVTVMLTEQLESPKPLSILDLQGLGKDVWAGVDAGEHIRHERESWD